MFTGKIEIQSVRRGNALDLRLGPRRKVQAPFVAGEERTILKIIQQNKERMKSGQNMVFVIVVATQNNQLVFRNIRCARNQPFGVVSIATMRNMGSRRFGETVNGGLCGNPLFSEEIYAVIRDNEGLTIEIGGIQPSREIGLVFVGKPYGIHFVFFVPYHFLADSQNMKIMPVTFVVAYVSEINKIAVLRDFLGVPVPGSLDTKGICNDGIVTIYSIETFVGVVIVGPKAVIPVKQRR